MKGVDEERIRYFALYMLENGATVRATATHFGVSKSTVHKDVSERLKRIDSGLHERVRELLDINKAERHIRGGIATREKYRELAAQNCEKDA